MTFCSSSGRSHHTFWSVIRSAARTCTRYAQRFPTEIAGLLFVEPAHPDWDDYMPEHLKLAANQTADGGPDYSDQLVTLARGQFEGSMFDKFPEDIRGAAHRSAPQSGATTGGDQRRPQCVVGHG